MGWSQHSILRPLILPCFFTCSCIEQKSPSSTSIWRANGPKRYPSVPQELRYAVQRDGPSEPRQAPHRQPGPCERGVHDRKPVPRVDPAQHRTEKARRGVNRGPAALNEPALLETATGIPPRSLASERKYRDEFVIPGIATTTLINRVHATILPTDYAC